MDKGNYWQTRTGRRRLLAATGMAAASAAFLAACGGGSDKKNDLTADKTSLIAKPADTSKDAKKGGTLLASRNQDVFTFDGQSSLIGGIGSATIYSRIVRLKPGVLAAPNLEIMGDLAESWELSPDKLTVTMKLRNMTWHNIAPVSGRKLDAQDIATSWSRWEKVGSTRGNYSAKVNPDAPIDSVTATDASTVTFKLSQPNSSLFGLLATANAGMFFMPKEADQGYDPRTTGIGSGPFYIANFTPSVGLQLKRHDGHYEASKTYIDEVKETIIPEYANGIAQFRAGNLHTYAVRQEDILPTKRDVPALNLYTIDPPTQYGIFRFGWNPAKKTPFRDKRLRQALAMSIDRDLWIDTFYNISTFARDGIALDGYQHSAFQANNAGVFSGRDSYWLDPKSKDFGPNQKYYQYNVAESKKLVQAVSGSGKVESVANYPLVPGYGDPFIKQMSVFIDMAKEAGIEIASNNPNFNVDFRPQFADSPGDFDGVTTRFRPAGGIYDPIEVAVYEFTPNPGNGFSGFYAEGQQYKGGDPEYTALLKKARSEFDDKKRIALGRDFQRIEAERQYQPSFPGTASGLLLVWPAVRNVMVFRDAGVLGGLTGDPALSRVNLWLDPSLPPKA
jgi:ABC-type transport system substrate-binding protein